MIDSYGNGFKKMYLGFWVRFQLYSDNFRWDGGQSGYK